ncbi:urease subunit beta [Nocardioides kongjuensis]|uniref:urease n=1 Tax=Nocardioides kongjuensis TaxID=349522 RepID=A0A852RFA5_9ACTN|nr:urease subunit beta [Nocardioides kongjuensis]NYD31977.1 urease subunit gamma/beta [Nocardioides kongjuensis]
MHLTPTENDHLQIFLVAELARRRLQRGVLLNAPEATAIVADAVVEAARDGLRHTEALVAGQHALSRAQLLPGVPEIVGAVAVEATFDDGARLVVVTEPFGPASSPPPDPTLSAAEAGRLPPGTVLRGEMAATASRGAAFDPASVVRLVVTNTGAVPITVTSHFHFFEVNPLLRFDRASAYGRRLALAGGSNIRFDPGVAKDVELVPIGGDRVVVGFSGYVDGQLDDPAVRDAAFRRAREAGLLGTSGVPYASCWPSSDGAAQS